ncbi:MAG: gfo/Idh/MocA family oxidoreductase [Acidobacteria bacterium]|nr:MAG: gfo/Idh/MocA family oxidoreductase [Acidobacteriota bacterium]
MATSPRGIRGKSGERALRVGLAGLGRHGARYARHLLAGDVPGAALAAVHRRDREEGRRFAERYGLAFHDTLEGLVADEGVEAVVAVLPPSLHPLAVELAAGAGKPILVEKPLAPSARGARSACAAARRAGIVAMVAQTLRYDATVRAVRARLAEIGPLQSVAVGLRYSPAGRGWIHDAREGGLLANIGVHGTDLIRHLTGCEVAAVRALEAAPGVIAALRLEPGGVPAALEVLTGRRSGAIELVGRSGRILADYVARRAWLDTPAGCEPLPIGEPEPTLPAVLADFAAAARGLRPPAVPIEEGLAAVEIVERVAAAAKEPL